MLQGANDGSLATLHRLRPVFSPGEACNRS